MGVLELAIPQALLEVLPEPEKSAKVRVQQALRRGLHKGLAPASMQGVSGSDDVQLACRVSESELSRLNRLRTAGEESSIEDTVLGVMLAEANEAADMDSDSSGERWIQDVRPEQVKLCRLMAASSARNQVLLAEASTGTGKGRALGAHAAFLVRTRHAQRVVIAAPTIAIVGQLMREYDALSQGRPKAASVIGIGEFVSEQRLLEILESDDSEKLPDVDLAKAWLEHSATDPWGPLKKRWLCASLLESAPMFPLAHVRLSHYDKLSPEEDRGLNEYLDGGDAAEECKVVFCTHAMLALDVARRRTNSREVGLDWSERPDGMALQEFYQDDARLRVAEAAGGQLPEYDHVLIDEAHTLSENFLLGSRTEHSLFSLLQKVEAYGNASMKRDFRKGFKALKRLAKYGNSLNLTEGGTEECPGELAVKMLKLLARSIKKHSGNIRNVAVRAELNEFEGSLYWLDKGKGNGYQGGFDTRLQFSPVRDYPLVERSRLHLGAELSFLWEYVSSAVLTSATLYATVGGQRSARSLCNQLAISSDWISEASPIVAEWTIKPVTLHLPPTGAVDESQLLIPFRYSDDDEVKEEYYDRLASWFERESKLWKHGGCLVLFTSYAAIDEIRRRLSNSKIARRLVVSERGESFENTQSEYLTRAEKGGAPIWLATGRAWTGTNLSVGRVAKNDNAVVALVIPRLPWLTNGTTAHKERVLESLYSGNRWPFEMEYARCARQVRQGVGRAVRRRGVGDRLVYLLDGRLSKKSRFAGIRREFEHYKQSTVSMMLLDRN